MWAIDWVIERWRSSLCYEKGHPLLSDCALFVYTLECPGHNPAVVRKLRDLRAAGFDGPIRVDVAITEMGGTAVSETDDPGWIQQFAAFSASLAVSVPDGNVCVDTRLASEVATLPLQWRSVAHRSRRHSADIRIVVPWRIDKTGYVPRAATNQAQGGGDRGTHCEPHREGHVVREQGMRTEAMRNKEGAEAHQRTHSAGHTETKSKTWGAIRARAERKSCGNDLCISARAVRETLPLHHQFCSFSGQIPLFHFRIRTPDGLFTVLKPETHESVSTLSNETEGGSGCRKRKSVILMAQQLIELSSFDLTCIVGPPLKIYQGEDPSTSQEDQLLFESCGVGGGEGEESVEERKDVGGEREDVGGERKGVAGEREEGVEERKDVGGERKDVGTKVKKNGESTASCVSDGDRRGRGLSGTDDGSGDGNNAGSSGKQSSYAVPSPPFLLSPLPGTNPRLLISGSRAPSPIMHFPTSPDEAVMEIKKPPSFFSPRKHKKLDTVSASTTNASAPSPSQSLSSQNEDPTADQRADGGIALPQAALLSAVCRRLRTLDAGLLLVCRSQPIQSPGGKGRNRRMPSMMQKPGECGAHGTGEGSDGPARGGIGRDYFIRHTKAHRQRSYWLLVDASSHDPASKQPQADPPTSDVSMEDIRSLDIPSSSPSSSLALDHKSDSVAISTSLLPTTPEMDIASRPSPEQITSLVAPCAGLTSSSCSPSSNMISLVPSQSSSSSFSVSSSSSLPSSAACTASLSVTVQSLATLSNPPPNRAPSPKPAPLPLPPPSSVPSSTPGPSSTTGMTDCSMVTESPKGLRFLSTSTISPVSSQTFAQISNDRSVTNGGRKGVCSTRGIDIVTDDLTGSLLTNASSTPSVARSASPNGMPSQAVPTGPNKEVTHATSAPGGQASYAVLTALSEEASNAVPGPLRLEGPVSLSAENGPHSDSTLVSRNPAAAVALLLPLATRDSFIFRMNHDDPLSENTDVDSVGGYVNDSQRVDVAADMSVESIPRESSQRDANKARLTDRQYYALMVSRLASSRVSTVLDAVGGPGGKNTTMHSTPYAIGIKNQDPLGLRTECDGVDHSDDGEPRALHSVSATKASPVPYNPYNFTSGALRAPLSFASPSPRLRGMVSPQGTSSVSSDSAFNHSSSSSSLMEQASGGRKLPGRLQRPSYLESFPSPSRFSTMTPVLAHRSHDGSRAAPNPRLASQSPRLESQSRSNSLFYARSHSHRGKPRAKPRSIVPPRPPLFPSPGKQGDAPASEHNMDTYEDEIGSMSAETPSRQGVRLARSVRFDYGTFSGVIGPPRKQKRDAVAGKHVSSNSMYGHNVTEEWMEEEENLSEDSALNEAQANRGKRNKRLKTSSYGSEPMQTSVLQEHRQCSGNMDEDDSESRLVNKAPSLPPGRLAKEETKRLRNKGSRARSAGKIGSRASKRKRTSGNQRKGRGCGKIKSRGRQATRGKSGGGRGRRHLKKIDSKVNGTKKVRCLVDFSLPCVPTPMAYNLSFHHILWVDL